MQERKGPGYDIMGWEEQMLRMRVNVWIVSMSGKRDELPIEFAAKSRGLVA